MTGRCIWNVKTGKRRLTIAKANLEHAFQVIFTPDMRLLACCGEDPVIRLFDPATGDAKGELIGHERTIQSLALGEDGRTLVSASSDMTARLWNLESLTEAGKIAAGWRLGPSLST